nr:ATP-grasp domain-containing protein [Desulfobulbaceae bacterium]
MKIAIVHNQIQSKDAPDATDVLVQADAIDKALVALGHQTLTLTCSLNLETISKRLFEEKPDLVFNLVEDLEGHGRLIHLFPALLDALRIPYTGSSAEAIFLSSHKTLAKEIMVQNALPTPMWLGVDSHFAPLAESSKQFVPRPWIIKSLWEHASLGLDADSVLVAESRNFLKSEMNKRSAALGGSCFAEEYIDGREFNLSLLNFTEGVRVLSPAEIVFKDYAPEMIRIVDYQAKWQEDSFGYSNTVRSFDFDETDVDLLHNLTQIALKCWHVFGLKGYARVDFRVDHDGQPFILEVNANPCLSPDAGFAAAIQQSGIDYDDAVGHIISSAGVASPQGRK